MLEGIRGYMMDRVLIKYRMLGENADVLCPRIRKRVEKEKEFARSRGKRAAPQDAGNAQGQKRGSHCSKCGSPTHNARTCPLNRANGIQDVRLNVADRRTIERELRVATTGYVRLNGARGRAFDSGPSQQPRAVEANVVELGGSQPPPSQH
ncbi:unnamed protein product [Linum trigynum]|uniref:CCHC-type domain-containing protein n=1 Tax=Linum trigynum TaxID=586398 RepID=A0AAV2ENM4_9ROSI